MTNESRYTWWNASQPEYLFGMVDFSTTRISAIRNRVRATAYAVATTATPSIKSRTSKAALAARLTSQLAQRANL